MSGIPKKGRRIPYEGAKYLTQIVGERSREIRTLYTSARDQDEVSQEEIAERMVILGHATWRRQTVALVEKAGRNLTVDELISLAVALQTTLAYLLNPGSVEIENPRMITLLPTLELELFKCTGRNACCFFENPHKIENISVPYFLRNNFNGIIQRYELLCFGYPQCPYKFFWRFA